MRYPLSKTLFYLLIFITPISTGKVFFTSHSFYFGYHAFYNSVWIYLTDIFICGLIVAWLWENRPLSVHKIRTAISQDHVYLSLLVFWLILAISTVVSRETWLSFYELFRFTEYFLLFVYIRESVRIVRIPGSHRSDYTIIFWLILGISVLEAVLGITQYLSEHSLGLKLFGESLLIPGLKGIAEFRSHGIINRTLISYFPSLDSISHETINIRAYGTLPHPNVLGVLLFTGFLANLWLLYNVSQKWKGISREIFLALSLIIISTGLVLTFSRTVWAAAAGAVLVLYVSVKHVVGRRVMKRMREGARETGSENYHPARLLVICLLLLVALGLNWFLFGQQIKDRLGVSPSPGVGGVGERSLDDESLLSRELFNSIALKMFRAHPVLGVGLHNFVARMDDYNSGPRLLPYLHQPAHNIYLLILAETGAFGLAAFVFLLFNIIWQGICRRHYFLLLCFAGFLFLGLFDHYFLSIHQAGLLFWTVAGLLTAKQN